MGRSDVDEVDRYNLSLPNAEPLELDCALASCCETNSGFANDSASAGKLGGWIYARRELGNAQCDFSEY